MQNTKKARTVRALKQLVLSSNSGVSRADAARELEIDLRTAAAYLEQLTAAGLLCCEKSVISGKGRPHTVYRSNAAKLAFLGVKIYSDLVASAVLVDAWGHELERKSIVLQENISRLSVFTSVLGLVKSFENSHEHTLFGIGLAISRWLQPPLAGEDVYANLADYLSRETNLPVHRDVNINAAAFALAKSLECRDLALIHTGNVLEFGLVRDGFPELNFTRREAWLSHLCVNPNGRRCYCGKYGGLENYVTAGARSERLGSGKNPATLRALGEMLGVAMVRLAHKYQVEKIAIMSADDIFFAAEEYFSSRVNNCTLICCKRALPEIEYSAALEAAYLELHRFSETKFTSTLNIIKGEKK